MSLFVCAQVCMRVRLLAEKIVNRLLACSCVCVYVCLCVFVCLCVLDSWVVRSAYILHDRAVLNTRVWFISLVHAPSATHLFFTCLDMLQST